MEEKQCNYVLDSEISRKQVFIEIISIMGKERRGDCNEFFFVFDEGGIVSSPSLDY